MEDVIQFSGGIQFLTHLSRDPPVGVHLLAGSIQAGRTAQAGFLLQKMRMALSLCPRPAKKSTPTNNDFQQVWEAAFDEGRIQRDGFIPQRHQDFVQKGRSKDIMYRSFKEEYQQPNNQSSNSFSMSPGVAFEQFLELILTDCQQGSGALKKTPIAFLTEFYSNARHQGDELPLSPVGKLIGAYQMDG